MAGFLLPLGLGLQAGSSLLSGFLGSKQKKQEAAIHEFNAAVTREKAKTIKNQFEFAQKRQAEEASRTMGTLEASLGGSGTVTTEGAPMLAMALQESESILQDHLIGVQGRVAVNEALSQAQGFDFMARAAKDSASLSLLSGFLGAGASGLMAFGSIPQKENV
jgi:hypothetical protein